MAVNKVIEVYKQGPQGPAGEQGPLGSTALSLLVAIDTTEQIVPDHDGSVGTETLIQFGTIADENISISEGVLTYLNDMEPFPATMEIHTHLTSNNKTGTIAIWLEASLIGGPWFLVPFTLKTFSMKSSGDGAVSFDFSPSTPRLAGDRVRARMTNMGDAGAGMTVRPPGPLTVSSGEANGSGVRLTIIY